MFRLFREGLGCTWGSLRISSGYLQGDVGVSRRAHCIVAIKEPRDCNILY